MTNDTKPDMSLEEYAEHIGVDESHFEGDNTPVGSTDSDIIKLTDEQQKRIAAIQEQSTEGGQAPELSVSHVIDSLLDTWDAVEDGYYTEDHTPNSELRELVTEMRHPPEDVPEVGVELAAHFADELESVIQDG